jgi:hypothetical protein
MVTADEEMADFYQVAFIDIAVAKVIGTKPNPETLTSQSFSFCLLPSALCLLL